jgi:DNA-binding LytR/AlgR family response regulator
MDCLIVDDDILSRKVLKRFIDQTDFLSSVKECGSAIEANRYLMSNTCDLLFLDVEMPGMTGLELISILRTKPQIILVSSKKEYAVDAFDNDAIDYLVKPVAYSRFLKACQKAWQLREEQKKAPVPDKQPELEYIFLKVDSSWLKLQLSDILYVQALADYVCIFAKAGSELKRYVIHSTMKAVEKKLTGENFVRVHRSYIVNTHNVSSFSNDTLFIADKQLPIGITYKNSILQLLGKNV